MECLYFGPTATSGIFHIEAPKAFGGLAGVTNINNNLLVYTKCCPNHYDPLKAMLDRCVELSIIKKLYGPFSWMRFNCHKARATSRRQFTCYH